MATDKEWRQHMLTRETEDKTLQVFLCWIEVDKRIKVGSQIRLKGQRIWWKVTKIFDLRTSFPPRQDWKVGGLR